MTSGFPGELIAAVADLVWPRRCVACGVRLGARAADPGSRAFCSTCAVSLIPADGAGCSTCGLPFGAGSSRHRCATCLLDPPAFTSARAAYLYGGALADAITRFKYGKLAWLAAALGDLLLPVARAPAAAADVIVPIPLHPRRLIDRGFNQSALLASRLARRLSLPLDTRSLRRIEDTPPQATLTRAARLTALRGAFAVGAGRRLSGARILLVDDVVTTTATVRAAAAALRRAHAAAVEVISLARAEWPDRVADRGQTG